MAHAAGAAARAGGPHVSPAGAPRAAVDGGGGVAAAVGDEW